MINIPVWLFVLIIILVFGFSSLLIASFSGAKYFEYDEIIAKLKEENTNIKNKYEALRTKYIKLNRRNNMINTIAENIPEQIRKQIKN